MIRALLYLAGLIAIFAFVMRIILDSDVNKTVFPHTPGPCRYVKGISNGSEDVVLLKSGHVLVSNGKFILKICIGWAKRPPIHGTTSNL